MYKQLQASHKENNINFTVSYLFLQQTVLKYSL